MAESDQKMQFLSEERQCCKDNCINSIPEDMKSKFHRIFSLCKSFDAQCAFIVSNVQETPSLSGIKRRIIRYYHIEGRQICLKSFATILRISKDKVSRAMDKLQSGSFKDNRGGARQMLSTDSHSAIVRHINSFPHYVSRHRRGTSESLYLDPELTRSKIYKLFQEKWKTDHPDSKPPSLPTYFKIFESMGLKFKNRKADTRKTCDKMQKQTKTASSSENESIESIRSSQLPMSEDESCLAPLESIVKVEPYEFRIVYLDSQSSESQSHPLELPTKVKSEKKSDDVQAIRVGTFGSETKTLTVDDLITKSNEGSSCIADNTCGVCGKVYSNRTTLKRHFENVHSKSKKMFCDLCPKVYFIRESMSSHMRTVHCKKFLACNVCDYKTAKKFSFRKHKMTHAAKVECPICLKQVSVLKSHMERHKPKVPCPICQMLVHEQSLQRHMNRNHSKIKCEECGENLESKKDLHRHKLIKHYDGEIFECHCGSVFNTKGNLKEHQKDVHRVEKVKCPVCKKQFATKKYLKFHLKVTHLTETHGNEIRDLRRSGPFICDKCGSKLATRSAFKQHTYKHHHLMVQPYQCKDCKYKSFYKQNITSHMKKHGSTTECKVCHKFVTNMQQHLRYHVKVECSICRKIVTKRNLSKHLEAHEK